MSTIFVRAENSNISGFYLLGSERGRDLKQMNSVMRYYLLHALL